jgi:DNA-binding NarL/FixJ family response regulator
MDIKLPGMNGFDSTRAIKAEHPAARVLIVSAYNEPQFHELARSSGAVGFILKENILALRMMVEGEMKNNTPSSAAPDKVGESA